MDELRATMGLPPGSVVLVLGPATAVLTWALWEMGLRPVRGQRHGSVWARPQTSPAQ